jgi:hypothetical protein
MLKDTKGYSGAVNRRKERQHNDQKRKDQQRSTKQYTENEWSSNTNPTKIRGELMSSGRVSSSCSSCDTRRVTVKLHEIVLDTSMRK